MGNWRQDPSSIRTYAELHKHRQAIRDHAERAALNLWRRSGAHEAGRSSADVFKWGEEVEYLLTSCNPDDAVAISNGVTYSQAQVLSELESSSQASSPKSEAKHGVEERLPEYQPEFASFMVESSPPRPRDATLASFLSIEEDMRRARTGIQAQLGKDEKVVTMACAMRLGALDVDQPFTSHEYAGFRRYAAIAIGVRERRLRPLENHSALFVDRDTHATLREKMAPDLYSTMFLHPGKPLIPHGTHLLGGAMAGLQVTIQGPDARATRWLHDQLMALSPILMALTASSPAKRGFLSDTDSRWEVMEKTLDDRTAAEESEGVSRSRCTTYPLYVAEDDFTARLNDAPVLLDDELVARLERGGMDHALACFYAHLFSREPLLANNAMLQEAQDPASDGHLCFEATTGSHWPTVKLRPPSADFTAGWRAELRAMEPQPTDFENGAFCVFVALLSSAILADASSPNKTDFRMPISQLDANFQKAQQRDAVLDARFHVPGSSSLHSIDEIVNDKITGLAHFIETRSPIYNQALQKHLSLVQRRASGEDPTPAHCWRGFLTAHPAYQADSRVSFEMYRDLLATLP